MCEKDLFQSIHLEKSISYPHILEAISFYKESFKNLSVDSEHQTIEYKESFMPKEDFVSLKHIEDMLGKKNIPNPITYLSITDKIFLYKVLNAYDNSLRDSLACNESLLNAINDDLSRIVEENDAKETQKEKKSKFTDEQMVKYNLVQNKKFLAEAKVNSYDRMTIYNTIKEWFEKFLINCKDNRKAKTYSLQSENYKFDILAKLGEKKEQIYKITKAEHK
ncbi:MAG: hypothetical protein K6E21_03565 [Bacilli bacterium]|nr:hypothetical protein [Bacilli bacterium]